MTTLESPSTDAGVTNDAVAKRAAPGPSARQASMTRRIFMRPRRALVRLHRWVGIGLFAWLIVVGLTGSWLAVHHAVESWIHSDRYEATDGDVGPEAAVASATEALPEDSHVYGVTDPRNGRGVYLVYGELPLPEGAAETQFPEYVTVYVDPGSGDVNGIHHDSVGANHWLYRGHEFLWQDHGLFGAFDPETGWCRAGADGDAGHEPGGLKGVACDVIPDGMDMIGWFAVGFIFLLVGGFYLWYWPGVRRWATALVVKRNRGRFNFHLSLHRVIGLICWVPLTVIAFTGAAFAFPNLNSWYENATPAQRDFFLWEPPESLHSHEDEEASAGTEAEPAEEGPVIGLDEARRIVHERFPDRAVNYMGDSAADAGYYDFWVTRGFDPWTREGGAGNTYTFVDAHTGAIVYDGSPEDGNVFDQGWDDWSFPLHTGDFGGTTTRVIWAVLGTMPLVLGATGIVMQFVRRNKRKKAAARAEARQATAVDAGGDGTEPATV